MDLRAQKVITLINDNFHRGLLLHEIAKCVNISPSRLRHMFKAETGTTPTQYLKTLRLQKAKDLLETTFMSVKEITARVGMGDESHFVRDFKKNYGLSPMQHRLVYFGGRFNENMLTEVVSHISQ